MAANARIIRRNAATESICRLSSELLEVSLHPLTVGRQLGLGAVTVRRRGDRLASLAGPLPRQPGDGGHAKAHGDEGHDPGGESETFLSRGHEDRLAVYLHEVVQRLVRAHPGRDQ